MHQRAQRGQLTPWTGAVVSGPSQKPGVHWELAMELWLRGALRGAERGSLCKCALGGQERMGRSQDPCSQGANILALEEMWVATATESHEAAPGQGAETLSGGQVCVVLGSGDLTRWPRPGSPSPIPRGPQGLSALLQGAAGGSGETQTCLGGQES